MKGQSRVAGARAAQPLMPSPATQHRGAAGRPSVSKEMRGKLPRRRGGALLFHLISQLYEKTSLIVTPNLYLPKGWCFFGAAKR